jgi:putative transposase
MAGRHYVGHVNVRYRRTGTLWGGRYKSCLVDTDRYLLTCYRYIELNPVRAAMVATPGEYRWSSYHANAEGAGDPLVRFHPEYLRLGHDPAARPKLKGASSSSFIPRPCGVGLQRFLQESVV